MTIQELLKLAGEQGKVVILDEKGELKSCACCPVMIIRN
jgi:hypothetical protein